MPLFGSSFLEGLVTGTAKSVSRGVQGAMDDFDDRLSRLSEKRIQKMTTEKTRFDQEFRENEKEIKFLANLLNSNGGKRGMEVLQSIIRKEGGIEGAKAIIPSIVEKINLENTTAEKYLKLPEIQGDGSRKIVTSKQLADSITIPISQGVDFDYGTALQGSGMNLLNIFSNAEKGVADYAKKYVETDLALSGVDLKNLTKDFGETPPAQDITIDRFDLELGANLKSNLALVDARLRNTDPTDPSYNKLKNLSIELAATIKNNADKVPGEATLKTQTNAFNAELAKFLRINHRFDGGVYQLLDTKTNNSDLAATYSTLLTNYFVMSKSPKHRGKNNAPARGYIYEKDKNNIGALSQNLVQYNKPMNSQQFLRIAASNGLKVVFVTKEMIADSESDYYDADGRDPYMTVDGKINFDTNEFNNAANTYQKNVNTNPIRSNNNNINPTINNNAYVASVRDFQNTPDSGVLARAVRNGMKRAIAGVSTMNEAELKKKFKEETGFDWKPTFGSIL